MKKIIAILLTIISMFSFFILFKNENLKQFDNMKKVEQTLNNSYQILLPDSIGNENQNDIYNKMVKVLENHNANIYFTRIEENEKTSKYTYFTNLNYFNNFVITSGRIFDLNENQSEKFLSTENTGSSNQIGKLASFDGKSNFEINTLKKMIDDNKFLLQGYCTVQLMSDDNIDLFINDLEKAIKTKGIEKGPKDTFVMNYHYNKWIVPSLYFIIALLMLYSVLKSYKKFGVKMLLGHSKKDIWLSEVLNLLMIQAVILLSTNFIMSLFLFKEFNFYFINFLKNILLYDIESMIVFFVVSSLPFLYLNNIEVTHMIKNKLPIKEIIIFNTVIKVLLIVLLFGLMNQGIQNYDKVKSLFNNNYKKWEEVKGYYVLPFINNKNGDVDYSKLMGMQVPLYYDLNKEGAIFAGFYGYSPVHLELEKDLAFYEKSYVLINPNYLEKNTIYDENNEPISISETESNFILLVPDKFKEYETQILNRANLVKSGYRETSPTRNQEIKIIYTKSNQKLFSYEVDVNPTDGNLVTDPIIRVFTEKNGEAFDYGRIIGESGCPIKINTNSSKDPEEFIKAKLKKYQLDKYVDKVSPANEGIGFESKDVYDSLTFIASGLIILFVLLLIIVIQNINCFFEQYKKQLAIRQFNGYKFIDKYKELFVLFFITWSAAFIIKLCMGNLDIKIQGILTIFFMSIDLLITILTIKFVNKRKIISVIKGS